VDRIGEKMKRTIKVLTLCVLLLALCLPAQAQQTAKIPRIGYLVTAGNPGDLDSPDRAFRQGLRDLGYVEGQNILVEYRYLEGKRDRIPNILAELVNLKVDALVASTPPAIRAAKQATQTIPIVMVTTNDPVATGIVDSLARPGGNITGLTRLTRDLSGKRVELLREVVPKMSRVAVLTVADTTSPGLALKEYEAAARALKIPLRSLEVHGPNPDLEGAFRDAAKGRVNGLITATNLLLTPHVKTIADLAIKNRLPSMYERSFYVEAGGLMSYATSDADIFRRAAVYVDKILKGTKPADLPVEQPTKFELVINLKTAKQIGLTIPQSVLFRADKVIR
jgi:putative tryptophan/tyrosine transport system substrate-binding protein